MTLDLPPWDSDTNTLVCRQVRDETHDVRTFIFAGRTPCLFAYDPGQFMTFRFPGQPERCYTLASAPTRPNLIVITVKRVPDGPVSNWLHDTMAPGLEIPAAGPFGLFTTARHPAPKYLFLSAGSGITPLMSMTRALHDLASDADILFVHSARSPRDLIFRRELALIAHDMPNFRAVAICETDAPGERWGGYRGRLSLPMLRLIAPDLAEREAFTCGPTPYMASVRQILDGARFPKARYHEESFVFEDLSPEEAPPAEAATAGQSFRVEFAKSGKVIDIAPDRFILEAARAAGLRLPFSCARGLCGTCKSKLVSGQVDMKHEGGIRQREIDRGEILICCSKPLSDLVIER